MTQTEQQVHQHRINEARQSFFEASGKAIQQLNELNNLIPGGYPFISADITAIADACHKVQTVVPFDPNV